MDTYDYIVFIGKELGAMEPERAFKTSEEAIAFIKQTVKPGEFAEATFMPEDDDDTNIIVYKNY